MTDKDRRFHLLKRLEIMALKRVPCDITLLNSAPRIGVRVDPKFVYALMYGAGAGQMRELLSSIKLSDGSSVSLMEIWTINPMPPEGFAPGELEAVDLAEGEEVCGPGGETLRVMISKTYHCKSRDEEDLYLRRFLAS